MEPKSGCSCIRKISFGSSNLTIFFFFFFLLRIFPLGYERWKNNIKSKKKNVPGNFVSTFRSWGNNFFVFSVPCEKSGHTLFDWFELTRHFIELLGTFLCRGYVSQYVQSFRGFRKNLLKLELFKDKILVCISFLRHIHHKNWPISSAFNVRQK